MKALATARAAQGYVKRTPARCGTCTRRRGEKCGLGGFQVNLLGVCTKWTNAPTHAPTYSISER